jgi:hypothetical protein
MDRRLLLLSEHDNVLVTCASLKNGDIVSLDGDAVTVRADAPLGFKIARRDLAPGDKVLKYGAVIGSLHAPVAAGEHIHTHNLDSDYTPTYTLDEGKTFVGHA